MALHCRRLSPSFCAKCGYLNSNSSGNAPFLGTPTSKYGREISRYQRNLCSAHELRYSCGKIRCYNFREFPGINAEHQPKSGASVNPNGRPARRFRYDPCKFPDEQGTGVRDRFEQDCVLRQFSWKFAKVLRSAEMRRELCHLISYFCNFWQAKDKWNISRYDPVTPQNHLGVDL